MRPWIFKFDHKEGGLDRDNRARYIDVALATSAAPTFLPLAEIDYYDSKQFIDGGVWANNPSLVGLIEAWKFFVGVGKEYDSVQILSISSLNNTAGQPTGLRRQRSFIDWRDDLFETSMIGQSSFTDYFLKQLHALTDIPVEYVRIPSETISAEQQHLVQLDIATTESLRLIRGKGNDRGTLISKDPEISNFSKHIKHIKQINMANCHKLFQHYNSAIRLTDDKRITLIAVRDSLRKRMHSNYLMIPKLSVTTSLWIFKLRDHL